MHQFDMACLPCVWKNQRRNSPAGGQFWASGHGELDGSLEGPAQRAHGFACRSPLRHTLVGSGPQLVFHLPLRPQPRSVLLCQPHMHAFSPHKRA